MSPILLIVILIFCKHDQHWPSTVEHQFLKKAEWCWLYWSSRYSGTVGVTLTCLLILYSEFIFCGLGGWDECQTVWGRETKYMSLIVLFPSCSPTKKNKTKSLVCERKDQILWWYNIRLLQQTQVGFLSVVKQTFSILTFLFLIKS